MIAHVGENYIAPRDVLELQLAQLWEEVLDVRPISVTTDFFSIGGSSLSAMTLLIKIQEQLRQELPLNALFESPTIEGMAGILRLEQSPKTRSPLIALQATGSQQPFFCVHAGGGSALAYVELSHSLGLEQPFYAFEARGLNGGAEPFQKIEEMAAYYLEALRVRQHGGPYLLGGWSFGGVVAFEMAQQLTRAGHEVALLAMLDSESPAAVECRFDAEEDATKLLESFVQDLIHDEGDCDLTGLGPDAQLKYVWERARKSGVIPRNAGIDRINYLLQVFRSNVTALREYVPEKYQGRIVLFRAGTREEESTLGWGELATEPVEVHAVPGDHHSMMARPHVQVLAAELRSCLRERSASSK